MKAGLSVPTPGGFVPGGVPSKLDRPTSMSKTTRFAIIVDGAERSRLHVGSRLLGLDHVQ